MQSRMGRGGLVMVTHRLPVGDTADASGAPAWHDGPASLGGALARTMREHGGVWVGWDGGGVAGRVSGSPTGDEVRTRAVALPDTDETALALDFADGVLRPLYYDLATQPTFGERSWTAHVRLNERYARAAAAAAAEGAVVWVQDYELQLVPAILRRLRPDLRIGFFLHAPFPPAELFVRLPWREQILRGLLGADLVGFQRPRAVTEFNRLCRRLLGVRVYADQIPYNGRVVSVGAFAGAVDAAGLAALAARPEVRRQAARLRARLRQPRRLLLGVDGLDEIWGVGRRLVAFGGLGEDQDDAVLVQITEPRRDRAERHRRARAEIERLVGRVNGESARLTSPSVHYLHRAVDRDQLAALYLAADVMTVTPMHDVAGLLAKEYVAARADLGGAVVLSEFAGVADDLDGAFVVNPHDTARLRRTLAEAMAAPQHELRDRMRRMRAAVTRHDSTHWAASFLRALTVGRAPGARETAS
ncbi:trehalose-6-phosphate synthase [Actinomadura oligospora]|uniref:trehalose-6-phosphate synthase n=1 Tax=Actinomadura oligospora TaxID=111804 RepID=UPI0004B816D6|nr:trehalose-6-phosphate synthase [Actinomadura oligospora]